jgi:hypothetical protein
MGNAPPTGEGCYYVRGALRTSRVRTIPIVSAPPITLGPDSRTRETEAHDARFVMSLEPTSDHVQEV